MTETKPEVEAHLDTIDPTLRPLAQQLRELVLGSAPDLNETVKWRNVFYVKRDNVFAIVPHRAHANLEFWRGVDLADPHGLLEGTGKRARHVKVRRAEDVKSDALAALVREAAALDAD